MINESKLVKLIVKLNQLTSLGKIEWRVDDVPPSIVRGTNTIVPLFMWARYKDQRFGLYQNRSLWYDGEKDKDYWSEGVTLVLLDSEWRAIWETPSSMPALYDLFQTARHQVADIDGIIDNLLSDDDDDLI